MVLDLHQRAVGGRRGQAQNRPRINPRMPGDERSAAPGLSKNVGNVSINPEAMCRLEERS